MYLMCCVMRGILVEVNIVKLLVKVQVCQKDIDCSLSVSPFKYFLRCHMKELEFKGPDATQY